MIENLLNLPEIASNSFNKRKSRLSINNLICCSGRGRNPRPCRRRPRRTLLRGCPPANPREDGPHRSRRRDHRRRGPQQPRRHHGELQVRDGQVDPVRHSRDGRRSPDRHLEGHRRSGGSQEGTPGACPVSCRASGEVPQDWHAALARCPLLWSSRLR